MSINPTSTLAIFTKCYSWTLLAIGLGGSASPAQFTDVTNTLVRASGLPLTPLTIPAGEERDTMQIIYCGIL